MHYASAKESLLAPTSCETEFGRWRRSAERSALGSVARAVLGRVSIGEADGGMSLADLGMLLGDTQTCSFDPVEPPLFLKPCHKPQAGGAGGRDFLHPAISRISRTISHVSLGARPHERMFGSARWTDHWLEPRTPSHEKNKGIGAKRACISPSASPLNWRLNAGKQGSHQFGPSQSDE
jgi:hypothetical protein